MLRSVQQKLHIAQAESNKLATKRLLHHQQKICMHLHIYMRKLYVYKHVYVHICCTAGHLQYIFICVINLC